MRETCKGCKYRSISDDLCVYILETGMPRPCVPEMCRELGVYEKAKQRNRKQLMYSLNTFVKKDEEG